VSEPADTHGRAEDATLAALDDDAAVFSAIAGAVAVIAAHVPKREIRAELRVILDAIKKAKATRILGRTAYTEKRK
jgi:hypothetical protein